MTTLTSNWPKHTNVTSATHAHWKAKEHTHYVKAHEGLLEALRNVRQQVMAGQLCQTNENCELKRSKDQVWEEWIDSDKNIL